MATLNANSPAVKRILKELKELQSQPSSLFAAVPLDDNMFEIHFTIRGPRDTEFEGGIYHGKIVLPEEYPLKPPDIYFFTRNGRFEVGKKVCLTISSHHQETWQPSWSIRTAILAIIGFLPTAGDGALASLDWPKDERKKLARQSLGDKCKTCGTHNLTALPPEDANEKIDTKVLASFRLKNKAEQERDEQEKKLREQSKSAVTETTEPTTTTATTTTTTTTVTTTTTTSITTSTTTTVTTTTPTTQEPSSTTSGLSHRQLTQSQGPNPNRGALNNTNTNTNVNERGRNTQKSIIGQALDVAILVIIFIIFGLLMNKFSVQ